jgi:biopolymer transport protein ExbD
MKPMQSMFQRKRHQVPSLNVASMPDLIFTVLFFFMIVTHMRSDEVKVKLEVPQGTGVQKLANKASVVNIYIGQLKGEWGVQLNGDLIAIDDIPARIEEIRGGMSAENADKLTVSLRADRHTPMGIITDVKQALQQSYALRINYSATELKSNELTYE